MKRKPNTFEIVAIAGSAVALSGTLVAAAITLPNPEHHPEPSPTITKIVRDSDPVIIYKDPKPAPTVTKIKRVEVPVSRSKRTVSKVESVPAAGDPKSYARSLVGAAQFSCLNSLWQKESGWNYRATNPSSGAYGIPQSLPGSKMASAGADWRTNPLTQVRWGVSYIKGRYGSPCGAWNHSQQKGWY